MMTAMMMKINVSYESLLNMEFHNMKTILETIAKMSDTSQKG